MNDLKDGLITAFGVLVFIFFVPIVGLGGIWTAFYIYCGLTQQSCEVKK